MPLDNVDSNYLAAQQKAGDEALAREAAAQYPELSQPQGFQPPDQPQGVTRETLAAKQTEANKAQEAAGQRVSRLETATGAAEGVQTGLYMTAAGLGAMAAGIPAASAAIAAPILYKAQNIGAGGAIALARKQFGNNHPIIDTIAGILGGSAVGGLFLAPAAGAKPGVNLNLEGETPSPEVGEAEPAAAGEAATPSTAPQTGEAAQASPPKTAPIEPEAAPEPKTAGEMAPHTDQGMIEHALLTPLSDEKVAGMELEGEGDHALLKEPIDAMDMLRLNYYESGKKAELFDLANRANNGDTESASKLQAAKDEYLDTILPRVAAARHQMGLGLRHAGEVSEGPKSADVAAVLSAERNTDSGRLTDALLDLQDRSARARMLDLAASGGWNKLSGNLMNYYVEGLLSTNTLAIKASSDALMLIASPFERMAAEQIVAPIYRALGAAPETTVAPGETGAMMTARLEAMSDAVRLSKLAFRTGTSQMSELGQGAFEEASAREAPNVSGTMLDVDPLSTALNWYGEFVHLTTRGIAGITDFAGTIHYRENLGALAYRKAYWESASVTDPDEASKIFADAFSSYRANPPTSMVLQAADITRSQLFSDPMASGGKWGEFLQGVQDLRTSSTIARGILPFWPTPVNLFRRGMEFGGPTAALSRAWWNRVVSGTGESQVAIARAGIGAMMMSLISREYLSGNIEGQGPLNHEIRTLWLEDGHQPHAFKLGGYDIGNIPHPFRATLEMFANLAELNSHAAPEDQQSIGAVATLAMSRWIEEQSFFTNMNGVLGALGSGAEEARKVEARSELETQMSPEAVEAKESLEPIQSKGMAQRAIEQMAGGIVPTNIANVAHALDPVRRQINGISDEIRSRIPSLSKDLPPEVDLFGNPVVLPTGWSRWTGDLISVFKVTQLKNDPVVAELAAAGPPVAPLGRDGRLVIGTSGAFEKVNATPQQIYRASVLRGTMKLADGTPGGEELNLHDQLAQLIKDPEYKQLQPVDRAKQLENVILAYTHAAQAQVMAENPDLQQKWTQARMARQTMHAMGAVMGMMP